MRPSNAASRAVCDIVKPKLQRTSSDRVLHALQAFSQHTAEPGQQKPLGAALHELRKKECQFPVGESQIWQERNERFTSLIRTTKHNTGRSCDVKQGFRHASCQEALRRCQPHVHRRSVRLACGKARVETDNSVLVSGRVCRAQLRDHYLCHTASN